MSFVEANARARERFAVSPTFPVPAELVLADPEGQRCVYACELGNISLSGCSIRTREFLPPPPQHATLRIVDESLQIRIEAAGRLCWSRQKTVGLITCGFPFRREIPESILERLIAEGVVNRRETPRRPLHMQVTIRRQGSRNVLSATILDVSESGLQIQAEEMFSVGERVLLTMPDGRSGAVRVVWTAVKNGHNCCGCAYMNMTSSAAISRAIEEVVAE